MSDVTFPVAPARVTVFGIGAGKAGSSWLAAMLMQHPRVFIPPQKELHFFNREAPEWETLINPNYGKSLSWYHHFYSDAATDQLLGDMTPAYLLSSTAAADIAAYAPEAKLIVTLRDPLDTAFSMYRYRIQRGVISPRTSFAEAIRSDRRIVQNSSIGTNLEKFLEYFSTENFHYVFFEDIEEYAQTVIDQVCDFLDIERFTPSGMTTAVNTTGAPRFPLIARGFRSGLVFAKRLQAGVLIRRLKRNAVGRALQRWAEASVPVTERPVPTPDAVALVADQFDREIRKLESMTGRDLSSWREHLNTL